MLNLILKLISIRLFSRINLNHHSETQLNSRLLEVSEQPPSSNQAVKRTRLLLFCNSVAIGGMEEHIKLLVRHLDRTKFEVFTICPEWEPLAKFSQTLAELSDNSARITPDRRYGIRRQFKETLKLYRQLRRWKIRTIHMHSTTYRGEFLVLIIARLTGVSKIYVTEHLAPEKALPFGRRITRNLFSRLVDGIVCVSEKNFQARAHHIFTPLERTLVVNNGVDLDDFKPVPATIIDKLRDKYNIPFGVEVVGTVVRFEAEKGLNYLIDAATKILKARPETHFLMVGDGSLRQNLEDQVASLGLINFFHFTGFQNDPRPYLALMDVFVLPVPVGSMSIGLLEAMGMEKAIVITFGGPGEAIVDGESGLWAEPRNPTALARSVLEILENPLKKVAFGKAARQRIVTGFSAQQVARPLEKLYLQS